MSTDSDNVRSIQGTAEHAEPAVSGGEKKSPQRDGNDNNDCISDSASQRTTKGLDYSPSRISINVENNSESTFSDEEPRPPLPPRPANLNLLREGNNGNSLQVPKRPLRPQLQSQTTIAVSRTDIHSQTFADGSRETYANSTSSTPSRQSSRFDSPGGRLKGISGSEGDDSASIRSYAPTIGTLGDAESLLGDVLEGAGQQSPAWKLLSSQTEKVNPFNLLPFDKDEPTADFNREFDELGELDAQGENEGVSRYQVGYQTY